MTSKMTPSRRKIAVASPLKQINAVVLWEPTKKYMILDKIDETTTKSKTTAKHTKTTTKIYIFQLKELSRQPRCSI